MTIFNCMSQMCELYNSVIVRALVPIPTGTFMRGVCMFSLSMQWFSLRSYRLLPQSKNILHRLTGVSRLSSWCKCVSMCMDVRSCNRPTGQLFRVYPPVPNNSQVCFSSSVNQKCSEDGWMFKMLLILL